MKMLVIYGALGLAPTTWTAALSLVSPHITSWLVPPFVFP